MAGWGIGFGGFVNSLEKGMAARRAMEDQAQRREVVQQEMQLRDQRIQANDMKLNDARRKNADAQELRGISAKGMQEYDKSGSTMDADQYYSTHIAPRIERFFLERGEPDKAESYRKFAKQITDRGMVTKRAALLSNFGQAVKTNDFKPIESEFREFYNGLPAEVRGGAKFDRLVVIRQPGENGEPPKPDSPIINIQAVFKTKDGKTFTHRWDSKVDPNTGKPIPNSSLSAMQDELYAVSDPMHEWASLEASRKGQKEFDAKVALESQKARIGTREKINQQRLGLGGQSPQQRAASTQRTLLESNPTGEQPTPSDIANAMKQQDEAVKLYSGIQSPAPPIPGGSTASGFNSVMNTLSAPVEGALGAVGNAVRNITAPRPGGASSEPAPEAGGLPQYGNPLEELGASGQVSRSSNTDVGAAAGDVLRRIREAGSVGSDELARINAARKVRGLPPLVRPPSGISSAPTMPAPLLAAINRQRHAQGLPLLAPEQAAQLMTQF